MAQKSLSRSERITKTFQFNKIYKEGSLFKGGLLNTAVLANGLPFNRLGISVSAKSIKGSCQRNRMRRLIREVFRNNKNWMKKGYDVVIVSRSADESTTYKEVESQVIDLYKKAGLLQ